MKNRVPLAFLLTGGLTLGGAAFAGTVPIVSYDVSQTPGSGFGCWSHLYTGTIVDTGHTVGGSVVCIPNGGHVFNYSGETALSTMDSWTPLTSPDPYRRSGSDPAAGDYAASWKSGHRRADPGHERRQQLYVHRGLSRRNQRANGLILERQPRWRGMSKRRSRSRSHSLGG